MGWAGPWGAARVARVVLLVLGAAATANAVWLALTANVTAGTGMAAALGVALLAWGIWFPRLIRLRWIPALAVVLALALVALPVFLAAAGTDDNATGHEDAVIVLGAAVHGSELSRTLSSRLDRALDYHEQHPAVLVVVSGGQGPQEDVPEGVAMRDYLLVHGVPDALILVEDRATSTEQNFAFSKALLDQRLGTGYRVAYITDEFHVYRAGRVAMTYGLVATHVSSRTPWYFWLANYLREDALVVGLWLTQAFGR